MHELPDTARAVAKELMGPASPVGVRALPQAARVPRAHPRLARAMVISCSTLAVGSEPVVTGVRLARQARCFAWGVQPWPPGDWRCGWQMDEVLFRRSPATAPNSGSGWRRKRQSSTGGGEQVAVGLLR